MSNAFSGDIESMLRAALAPVEPPERLSVRLEETLTDLADLAAEELADWELKAMRDPRNWARPAAAAAIGAGAGVGLVALRMRSNHKKRVENAATPGELAEATLRAIAAETRRVLDTR